MFKLAPLPYDYDALSPVISSETLEFHHDKHHRGYVEKLNELVEEKGIQVSSLDDLLLHASGEIYNNAGQIWNHEFYWKGMRPPGEPELDGELAETIDRCFGSMAQFKQQFEDAGAKLFGSGWVWLVTDTADTLQLFCGSNADNPHRHGTTPLLVCDVWEHAYYLDYRNVRDNYLHAYWDVVNWSEVANRYRQRPSVQSAAPKSGA